MLRYQRCACIGCKRRTDQLKRFGPIRYVSDEQRQHCMKLLRPVLCNGVLCTAHYMRLRRRVQILSAAAAAVQLAALAAHHSTVSLSASSASLLSSHHAAETLSRVPAASSATMPPSSPHLPSLSSSSAPSPSISPAISSTVPVLNATPISVADAAAESSFISRPAILHTLYTDRTLHPGLAHLEVPQAQQPQPPHLSELSSTPADMYTMPVVAFNVPDLSRVTGRKAMSQVRKQVRRWQDVLSRVRASQPSNGRLLEVLYQRDNEGYSGWRPATEDNIAATLFQHAFNPHRFALHWSNLCCLMLDIDFAGFSSPSWYVKLPNSFFCMHVEQLFAPFYNYCYKGSTTWWVVQREDRAKLEEYLLKRAQAQYGVGALPTAVAEAVLGLLYTKGVVFHPDDLRQAGVRLTEVRQEAGAVVMGDGDLVHFGIRFCTPSADRDVEASSTNEAVNFLPLQWLTTGLPRLLDWMRWLCDCWLPMQRPSALDGTSDALREAMQAARTNELVALHCAPLWSHELLTRLQKLLEAGPTPASAHQRTRQAIHGMLTDDGMKAAVRNIQAVLAMMEDVDVKAWLLQHSQLDGRVPTGYLNEAQA